MPVRAITRSSVPRTSARVSPPSANGAKSCAKCSRRCAANGRRMRVVIRTHVLAPQFEALAARHGVDAVAVADGDAMRRELADADALWAWPAFYDAELVALLARHGPRLRWVQLPTMGYDPVELHGVPRRRHRDDRGRRIRTDRCGARGDAAAGARAPAARGRAQRRAAPLGPVRRDGDRHAARRDGRRRRIRQHRPRGRETAARLRRARHRGDAQRPARSARGRSRSRRTGCSRCSDAATPSCSLCRSTRRRGTSSTRARSRRCSRMRC